MTSNDDLMLDAMMAHHHPSASSPADTCPESLPDTIECQFKTRRLLAFLVVGIAVAVLFAVIVSNSMANLIQYSKVTGFPNIWILISGIIVSSMLFAYCCYIEHTLSSSGWIIFAIIMYAVSVTFWALNLTLRVEYYVKGASARSNGTLYLLLTLASVGIIMLNSSTPAALSGLMVVVLWWIYVTGNWWSKV